MKNVRLKTALHPQQVQNRFVIKSPCSLKRHKKHPQMNESAKLDMIFIQISIFQF